MHRLFINALYTLVVLTVLYFALSYYPKWQNRYAEATISWDVSGYYFYLPALFIYDDIKQLSFKDDILGKYHPTPDFQQGYKYNQAYVLKYPCGQSIVYAPFFLIAHSIALMTDYPPDGFSTPYQVAISLGSLFIAFLGLWMLRKTLRLFFTETATSLTIFSIVIGTNYLEYAAITNAMPHNYLFTLYCFLIYFTISFYKSPSHNKAIAIGGLIGLAALIRPTEIVAFLIPLFWGLSFPVKSSLHERIAFIRKHIRKVLLAILCTLLLGSIQLLYWYHVSGEWIVYSYEDQGFSWLKPHLYNGLLSFRSGWLVYSPLMGLSLLGFIFLYREKRHLFITTALFTVIFMYITFAWDIWWYGGSLGQRAMIHCYPILAFPLASIWEKSKTHVVTFVSLCFIALICCYHNIWLTLNCHNRGVVSPGNMTKAYFLKVLWKNTRNVDDKKLLDTDEYYEGERQGAKVIYSNDFETDEIVFLCDYPAIAGERSLCLTDSAPLSDTYFIPITNQDGDWVRATAQFYTPQKEWNFWFHTQFRVKFYWEDTVVKEKFIRVHRLMDGGETRSIHIDTHIPETPIDKVGILLTKPDGGKTTLVDNLIVETYYE